MGPFDDDEIDASHTIQPPDLDDVQPPVGVPPPLTLLQPKFSLHANKIVFACKYCANPFNTREELTTHEQEHAATSKPYMCEYCDKCFSSKSQRERHHRTHTGEKPHKCWICQKRFAEKANLQVHQIVHTGHKPYKCQECDQRYTQRGALRTHIRSHTGERPFKCEVCGKGFKSAGVLKIHMRTHSDEKAFSCDFAGCGKDFKHKSTLVTHKRVHTGEKPYPCDSCSKRFADKAALIVHRRRLHSNVRPYICKECDKRFSENSSLRRHQTVHTGARHFWCDVCKKGFATSGSRSSHYKTKLHQKNAEVKGIDWTMDDRGSSEKEHEPGPVTNSDQAMSPPAVRRTRDQSTSPPVIRVKPDPVTVTVTNGNSSHPPEMISGVEIVTGMTTRPHQTRPVSPPIDEEDQRMSRSRSRSPSVPPEIDYIDESTIVSGQVDHPNDAVPAEKILPPSLANGVPPPPPTSSTRDQDVEMRDIEPPKMNGVGDGNHIQDGGSKVLESDPSAPHIRAVVPPKMRPPSAIDGMKIEMPHSRAEMNGIFAPNTPYLMGHS